MSLGAYYAKSLLNRFEIKNVPIDPYGIAKAMRDDDCEG